MAIGTATLPLFTPRAGSSSGGGGGGSSLIWSEPANAPVLDFQNNAEVYLFGAGLAQELYTTIRIPSSYSAGGQINLRVIAYSPDSSGNFLMRAQSTLIRTGTDAISSTTNQRTATNTAIGAGAGTVNKPQSILLDVTSSSGQVNSVAVASGDLLIIRFYRDTDTATSDVAFLFQSCDISFS